MSDKKKRNRQRHYLVDVISAAMLSNLKKQQGSSGEFLVDTVCINGVLVTVHVGSYSDVKCL